MQVSSFSGWSIFCPFLPGGRSVPGFVWIGMDCMQSAGPPLLPGSRMALPRPGLPADVSLMSILFSAAVTGLWYHHPLKYRFQKEG